MRLKWSVRSALWLLMVALVGCGTAGGPQLTPWPTVPTQIRTERVGTTIWQYEQARFDPFTRPAGFVGPDGTIYLRHQGVIEVLSEQGQRIRSFALKTPTLDYNDITATPDGTFWVTAPYGSPTLSVFHLDANGERLGGFGHARLSRPSAIEVGPDGLLYILNYPPTGAAYVTVFDTVGTLLREFDFAEESRMLSHFPSLSLDNVGNLFVTQIQEPFNSTGVWVFDTTGAVVARNLGAADIIRLGTQDLVASPDGQKVYVAIGFEVYRIERNGQVTGRYGKFQSRAIRFPEERFYDIISIDVMPNGDVVIFDANDNFYQVVRVRF